MPINPVHLALTERRRGADRGGLRQRRDRDELPGGGLGSASQHDRDAGGRPGTCSATAWSSCRTAACSSTAATCSTTRFTASRATPSSIRPRALHRRAEHGARPLVPDVDGARRRPRHDILRIERDGRHEHGGRDLHRRVRMEPPSIAAGWTPPLYPRMHLMPDGSVFYSGSGRGSRIFNPATHDVVGGRRHHELRRHAHIRHVGAAAADAGERLRAARHDLRRRQPGNGDHRDHRSVRAHAALAVRAADVAGRGSR